MTSDRSNSDWIGNEIFKLSTVLKTKQSVLDKKYQPESMQRYNQIFVTHSQKMQGHKEIFGISQILSYFQGIFKIEKKPRG